MTRSRNALVIGLVVVLLIVSLLIIIPGSPISKQTRLGLDLKGGIELVYEGKGTPQNPKVTPQNIEDAIETIRKRTDQLGVSEPEIQKSGANQISIGLPAVKNAERAEQQVGTTAQLQFYDWEPNGYPTGSAPAPISGLFPAVQDASKQKPRAEKEDIPPGGPSKEVQAQFGGDQAKIEAYYDKKNDTAGDKFYLFEPGEGAKRQIIAPGSIRAGTSDVSATANSATDYYDSCQAIYDDFRDRLPASGTPSAPVNVPEGATCGNALKQLGNAGPPQGSTVVKVPRGIVVLEADKQTQQQQQKVNKAAPLIYYVLEDDSELNGSDIKDPKQQFDQNTNAPNVTFNFTDKGKKAFESVTKRIAQRGLTSPNGAQTFAITLDGQIVSNASVDPKRYPEGIDGSNGAEISGVGSLQDAQDLANSLRIGALPIDLQLISKTQVSATLGQQALDQGLLAGGIGLALVLLFLVLFYRVLGVVAAVALVSYAIFLFALVKIFGVTLTLPGIAGLILTLGVAADANIVIFERIKEEARAGASIPRAITAGYGKALKTIVDANVVTIGVAFILFMLATAGVRGFAFTLGIGTLVSLFTAVLATSAILGSMSRTKILRSKWALNPGSKDHSIRFDFSGNSRYFFSMSGVILVVCAFAIATSGINFGIDFESGSRITAPLQKKASVDDVRNTLQDAGFSNLEIQQVDDPTLGKNVYQIQTKTLEPGQEDKVEQALDKKFGVDAGKFSSDSIGPTFGQTVARTAIIAIIASLFLISIYIGLRFEFKYAVPVLIALAHDLLITAGVYALAQREVTTSTVAALLTILGFSLYDTIIVFDRVRENVPRMPRATFSQIVNRSMSEVVVRSLVTSFSTLLPILALMLFGGDTLKDFGFALLVGVASGAYSSIFIASPVLTHWKEREPVYRRRTAAALQEHNGVIPAYADGSIADVEPAPGEKRGRRRIAERPGAKGTPPREKPAAKPRTPAPTAEAEPEVVEPAVTEPTAAEPTPTPTPQQRQSSTTSTAGRGSTAEQRRAARRAARQTGAATEDAPSAASPSSSPDDDGGNGGSPADGGNGAAGDERHDKPVNRRRKKHGRSR